jgi:heme/copper-type cytochrome/quinol oxidase subunit 2
MYLNPTMTVRLHLTPEIVGSYSGEAATFCSATSLQINVFPTLHGPTTHILHNVI